MGMPKDELNRDNPRQAELPFDSDRKLMSTINNIDGKLVVIVKGAFDVMAQRCVNGDISKAAKIVEQMSSEALRVLAVGYKQIPQVPQQLESDDIENGLTFMGIVGMGRPAAS